MDLVRGPVRDAVRTSAPARATTMVGGTSAIYADVSDSVNHDMRVIFPVAAALILLILVVTLRSAVAPLYLLGAVVLEFAATLGTSVLVFQQLAGQAGVAFLLPLTLFLFVVALGTDYNILMTARLREEMLAGRTVREAVAEAVRHVAPAVGAAGLVLASSFGTLMLESDDASRQQGFAMAFGIIVASLVVSTILVPALAALAGRRAWWPGRAAGERRTPARDQGGRASTGPLESALLVRRKGRRGDAAPLLRAKPLASLYSLSSAPPEGVSSQSQAATLEFRNVSKTYDGSDTPAIQDLSFRVPAGEVCVLVGPSGCGKTTAMRLVNRMTEMSGGDILLEGTSVRTRRPADLRREIGYAIQQIGLFPHLTIEDNIATVPRLLGWSRERIRARVDELIELIGLDPDEMRGRYPAQLSGGQRQRVGVARALAADPPLLLMDEPFGAIDPINRERLQNELLRLQQRLRKTILFVTHDIDEAIKIGDRIAVLKSGGVLAQYATPAELLMAPADAFVEDFVGADRALKRLALTVAGDVALHAADDGLPFALVRDDAGRPLAWERAGERHPVRTVREDESLRDALSDLLRSPVQLGAVVDEDGRVLGVLGVDVIHELLEREDAEDARGGTAGTPSERPRPGSGRQRLLSQPRGRRLRGGQRLLP